MTAKYIIKILTLGDTLVGKSSIVLRFSDNRFDDNHLATIGIDYKTKYIKVKDASVKVLLWDTAGQEKFRNIARQYYKGANGVLFLIFCFFLRYQLKLFFYCKIYYLLYDFL